jgi:hypothetical protein
MRVRETGLKQEKQHILEEKLSKNPRAQLTTVMSHTSNMPELNGLGLRIPSWNSKQPQQTERPDLVV